MSLPELTKEEVLEAISEGVRQAVEGYRWMPGDEWQEAVLRAIARGTEQAIARFDAEYVLGAITEGAAEAVQP
jgi:thiamine monophosphate kinase